MRRLFCFGFGYSAQALARALLPLEWQIAGTFRDTEPTGLAGARLARFDGESDLPPDALEGVSHVLLSVPPDGEGDPVLRRCAADLARRAASIRWIGYLSTTGVYGDKGGAWVDEETPIDPNTERGRRRAAAEAAWLATALPVHIFRLAGIYGPGRSPLASVVNGTARRIVKPGQIFGRIHVEDIAGVLAASIAAPDPGQIYNVCDDEPCPPQDVVAYAARLLGRPAPPEVSFDEANLSPMARSFYADSKRVSNRKIKEGLGYRLLYPTFREGLTALAAEMGFPRARPGPEQSGTEGRDRPAATADDRRV